MSEWIPNEDWGTIVRNVPIVSVDLVVECPRGVVLGRRSNEPAKGEWFVPGGRVHKGETLVEAAHRIASEELGVDVKIIDSLGAFEHFYDSSDVGNEKHYVAHGFYVRPEQVDFQINDQHSSLNIFESLPGGIHKYVKEYLQECPETHI